VSGGAPKGKGINGGACNDEGMKGGTVYAGSFWRERQHKPIFTRTKSTMENRSHQVEIR